MSTVSYILGYSDSKQLSTQVLGGCWLVEKFMNIFGRDNERSYKYVAFMAMNVAYYRSVILYKEFNKPDLTINII